MLGQHDLDQIHVPGFTTFKRGKPHAKAAFRHAEFGDGVARAAVELILGALDPQTSGALPLAKINAFPERFPATEVE